MIHAASGAVITASLLTAVALWFRVGRSIRGTHFDKESSRLLTFAAMANILFCCALAALLACIWLIQPIHRGVGGLGRVAAVVLMILLPARVLWNYVFGPQIVETRWAVSPLSPLDVPEWVARQAEGHGIRSAQFSVSSLIQGPFVYGRRSRMPSVVIPAEWKTQRSDVYVAALHHELSHVSNGDVGFMTWAYAFLRGAWWPCVLGAFLFAVGVLTHGTSWQLAASATGLHAAAAGQLAVLFAVVSRRREALADRLASAFVTEGNLEKARLEMQIGLSGLSKSTVSGGSVWEGILSYLQDKALFSQDRRFWKLVLGIYSYAYVNHPSVSHSAVATSGGGRQERPSSKPELELSFWSGVSAGTFLVVLMITGIVWGALILGETDRFNVVLVPYGWFCALALFVAGYLSCLLVLPAWADVGSSRRSHPLGGLLLRHIVAFIGGFPALSLVVLGGGILSHLTFTLIVCLLFLVLATMTSFVLGTVMAHVWESSRCLGHRDLRRIVPYLGLATGGVLVILCALSLVVILCLLGSTIGAALYLGTLAGLPTLLLWTRGGVVSLEDGYLIDRTGPFWKKVEGRGFRKWGWALLTVSFGLPFLATCTVMGAVAFALLSLVWPEPDAEMVFLLGIPVVCLSVWIFSGIGTRRLPESPRHAVFEVCKGLQFLQWRGRPGEKLARVYAEECRQVRGKDRIQDRGPTVASVFELWEAADALGYNEAWTEWATKWLLRCENASGGFGVWPGSSSRLSSTYFALAELSKSGAQLAGPRECHLRWIRSCFRGDGPSVGPYSGRPAWEDTLFAVESVRLLGGDFDGPAWDTCVQWAKAKLEDAISSDEAECICACLKILRATGRCDEDSRRHVREWLEEKTRELATVRPANRAAWARSIIESATIAFDDPEHDYFAKEPVKKGAEALAVFLAA